MTASDSSWLKFWETFATTGFFFVLLGVIFEGVEHFAKFPKKELFRKRRIEKNAWLVLVVGLAMKLLGDNRSKRITDADNVRLNGLYSAANERAAKATIGMGTCSITLNSTIERNFSIDSQSEKDKIILRPMNGNSDDVIKKQVTGILLNQIR